jgi:hypothetical protein
MAARQKHCVHMTLAIVHDTEELDTHSDIGSREKPRRVIVVESPLSTFTIALIQNTLPLLYHPRREGRGVTAFD